MPPATPRRVIQTMETAYLAVLTALALAASAAPAFAQIDRGQISGFVKD